MHLQEHQRTPKKLTCLNPYSTYLGFHYSELEVITKSKSSEVDVGCSCLLPVQMVYYSTEMCLCQSWGEGGHWFWNPKPVLWKDEILGSLLPAPPRTMIRVWSTNASGSWALASCDIAQVQLEVSLLSLLQGLRGHRLSIKISFHYYSSSWKEQLTVT